MNRSIIWFRKGIRLHDNPALLEAIKNDIDALYPIYILDPEYVNQKRVGINRLGFLLEALHDLNNRLKEHKSQLLVFKGNPVDVIPKIIKQFKITKLCFESDTEPYSKKRDQLVSKIAKEKNVEVVSVISHTLYDPDRLICKNKGEIPGNMQSFLGLLKRVGRPSLVADDPPKILPPPKDLVEDHRIPTLQELKYVGKKTSFLKGGEAEGLRILTKYLANTKKTIEFEKPKTNPAAIEPDTTSLSPYLKFGCVSPRMFYYKLDEVYKKANGKQSQPPVSLLGQLYWREFFYLNGYQVPNYDRISGNPKCRLIEWDYNSEYIEAWKNGRTGYPWIDACIRQLHQHGWLHHLARHSLACFLTRGDLYQSWEHGAAVFDEYLIDADWSLNNGNWMWLSASAFFHQFFRVYSPVAFPKNYDKEGKFVKHYLPILKKFPAQYIYEPWNAPLDMQKRAGCIIGKDYPRPIVDHKQISKINIARMKEAYGKKKYGDSLKVQLAGSPNTVQTGSIDKNNVSDSIKKGKRERTDKSADVPSKKSKV